MKKLLFTLTFCVLYIALSSQENRTISGYIKDHSNGETLIGANVYIKDLNQGSISNEYGFYSLTIPIGTYNLEYSYLGYKNQTLNVDLYSSQQLNIELHPEDQLIEEIVITGESEDKHVSNTEMSTNKLDIQTIQKMPSLLGEVEILRSIQLLPGVSSVGEGASGFNVRGGSIDQNLVLLDEAPVYNSSHLFGFFSVFNPDAVKDVKLIKGGIPAQYGGRLSSILDVRMKEGNNKNLNINGGIGAIFSRLSVEAPIIKDKASFIVAGRRSYIDILSKPFLEDDLKDSALNFYDLTFKTNFRFNQKNRLFFSTYVGRDNFGFGDQAGFNWGNTTATLRWNHLFSDRLFSNITLYFSDYDYKINFGEDNENRFDWNARILNYSIKTELSYFISPTNVLKFGGQSIIYKFAPGNAIGVSEKEVLDISVPEKYAIESALFISNEIDFSPLLSLNYGLRWSTFYYTGKGEAYTFGASLPGERKPVIGVESYNQWEKIKTYNMLEPRVSLKYQLSSVSSLKASYNRMTQYIHLISNTAASTPVDIWTPSTNNLQPQIADQLAVGYFQNLENNTYELSSEVYYKKYKNLLDYIDGADILLNEFLEGDLLSGTGRAYGLELMLKKNSGNFTGWASYTIARSERKIDGISNNEWYPSRFDQTHNFSLTTFYELNDRWKFSSNFVIISGTPTTFPTSRFQQQGYVIPHNGTELRNNVRIPLYHRLDISATLQGKKNSSKKWQSEWVFSIYNLL